jgi:Asp-tRNA(Asn)/Glu-tRNA(Gln) amidotransferase A subunit family amidase
MASFGPIARSIEDLRLSFAIVAERGTPIAGSSLRPAVVRDALARREALIDGLESFLAARDAWIVPVFPTPAFIHRGPGQPIEVDGEPMPQIMANLLHNVVFNMTGHPVTTMPAGLSARGLPIGVQMVGRRWQEMALLDVAEQIAKRTGGYRLPPGYEGSIAQANRSPGTP